MVPDSGEYHIPHHIDPSLPVAVMWAILDNYTRSSRLAAY